MEASKCNRSHLTPPRAFTALRTPLKKNAAAWLPSPSTRQRGGDGFNPVAYGCSRRYEATSLTNAACRRRISRRECSEENVRKYRRGGSMKSHGKRRMISSCTETSGCRNDERVLRVHAYGPAGAAPKTCGSVTGKNSLDVNFFLL